MRQECKTFQFDRKAVSEVGTFEGFASTFGNVDLGGDVIERGAFDRTLKEWRAKGSGQLPALLFQHDMDDPIGEFTDMTVSSEGLFVKGKLWIDGPHPDPSALKAHRMLTGNGPKGMSIGFFAKESERTPNGERVIKDIELLETSIVTYGMNPKAVITDAKGLFDEDGAVVASPKQIEKALRSALGFSHDQARGFMAKGFKGLREGAPSTSEREGDDDPELLERLIKLNALLKGDTQ